MCIRDSGQAKLGKILSFLTCLVPLIIVGGMIAYADKTYDYNICMGREEDFRIDLDNFWDDAVTTFWEEGPLIHLPIYNLVRLVYTVASVSYILVVPVAYWKIYKFRNTQDQTVAGTI